MSRLLTYALKVRPNCDGLLAWRNYTNLEEKGRAAENVYYNNRDTEDLKKLKKILSERTSAETSKDAQTSSEKVEKMQNKQCRQ